MGVRIGDTVTLSAFEQRICEAIAQKRYANNRRAGVADRKMGGQSVAETDLYGAAAEYAFSKLFNTHFDCSIEPRSAATGTDVDKDSRLFVWRVDVKGTRYPFGRLVSRPMDGDYASHADRSTTDLFALLTGPYPTFTFRGFFRKEDMLDPRRIGDLGRGPTYIAQQGELYSPYFACPCCHKLAAASDFEVAYLSAAEEERASGQCLCDSQ